MNETVHLELSSTPLSRSVRSLPIQIVVTPSSGNGTARTTAIELCDALSARRYETRVHSFDDLDSLRQWAEGTGGDRHSVLICVGGDGTQSTTAVAAMRRSIPFLPVSSGFGNLFARAFHHPSSVEGALDLLERGLVVHADVGLLNGEPFLCQESYGLIAEVQEAVEAAAAAPKSRWRRWLAYYRAALRHLREAPSTRLRVVVDGGVVAVDAALVVVANVEAYGNWLPLVPDASPLDGLFDVFVMRATSRRQLFAKLIGRHLRIPGATADALLCRGQRVSVSSPGRRPKRDHLEVASHRLPVVVSPETAAALERDLRRSEKTIPRAASLVA